MKNFISIVILFVALQTTLINAYVNLETTNGRSAFDKSLYENALDSELCHQQIELIKNNTLLWLKFIESGLRIPRSITAGNFVDLGIYPQCIGINEIIEDTSIEGKYCTISVPANQSLHLPQLPSFPDWIDGIELPDWITNPRLLQLNTPVKKYSFLNTMIDNYNAIALTITNNAPFQRSVPDNMANVIFTLAVCVPKACTIEEGLSGLLFNVSSIGFRFEEKACRFRNDKPWVPADYIAICLFSIIGILTITSTSYDVWKTVLLKADPKSISTVHRSFSVYTNCRRLTTFTRTPGTLDCLDGIRSVAMIWVIVGHTFFTLPHILNALDAARWVHSFRSFWITSAPITVDTFFVLSGLLLVYTTANKMTGRKLIKNLHLFYLSRILRMFPLLALAVLVQASIMHRISDGPEWEIVAAETEKCRKNWWITLLYLQNILDPNVMCIGLTWYLALDMQLHIISPIVLFFVLGRRKKVAWSALIGSLLAVLAGAGPYIFSIKVRGAVIAPNQQASDYGRYFVEYYINTLARASPFFVGMIFGYILHLYRENKMYLSKFTAMMLWICAFSITSLAVYASEPMKDSEWDNQLVDSFVNFLTRPAWAVGLGWIIVACVQGYGGPINWFLCLPIWKLPARISYAMYLFHMMFQITIYGSTLAPVYFSVWSCLYSFVNHLAIALVVGFVATLIFDSPFSTLFKLMLGGMAQKRLQKESNNKDVEYNNGSVQQNGEMQQKASTRKIEIHRL